MHKIATAFFTLASILVPICTILADELVEPNIATRFYSAEACEAIPKIKHLHAKNPGFNKVLIKLEGFPKQKEILLEIKRPLGPKPDKFEQVASFFIQEDGTYLLPDDEKVPYIIGTSRGFLPGERIIARFRTTDGSVSAEKSGIPMPAIFKDKNGNLALRAELLSVSPTVYTIDLPKMKDGDEYELQSKCLGETIESKGKYSTSTPMHYSPAPTTNNTGCDSTLVIRVKSGESKGDIYTMKLPWGTALEPYRLGGKSYPYHN